MKNLRKLLLLVILMLSLSGFSYKSLGQTTYVSAVSGLWDDGSTWVGGVAPGITDNAVISTGTTVSLQGSDATINDLTIDFGGVLNAENKIMSVNGTLIVNGTFTSKNSAAKDFEFNGAVLEGAGSIIIDFVNKDFRINNNATISSSSELIFYGNVLVGSNVTVTNEGSVEVTDNLNGNSENTSIWTNASGSLLKIGQALLAAGRLNASAAGNTVEYYSTGDQNIKIPAASTYNNLILRSSGNKNIQADIIISGDLGIYGSAVLASNNFNIELRGDWNNFSEFTEGTGAVRFTGSEIQNLYNPVDEYFSNLTINKTGGEVVLGTNTVVGNTFTLSNGALNASSFRLTLGTGLATPGTLAYTGGYIRGKFEKWINTTGTHLFPVGADRAQQIWFTLNSFTSGGTLIAEFIPSDPGNNGLSLDDAGTTIYNTFVEGYWVIDRDNGFTIGGINNYDIQLNGNGFTSFIIDPDTRILTRSDEMDIWIAEGNHVAGIGQSARRAGLITNPAHYALGDKTACVRPVTSAITGPTDVCAGQTSVAYSVADNPPNTYTWTITGGVQTSGSNTSSITVDWGITGMDNASVKVVETNTCTSGAPVTLPVVLHSVPPESITGKTTVPENTNGVPYSVTPRPGYTYTWIITGGNQASGEFTNSITVDWGPVGMGSVEVIAELSGCSPAPAVKIDVRKYDVIESIATGDWDDPATWDCDCVPLSTQSARIRNGHTVNLHNSNSFEITNMIIDLGGTLDYNSRPFKIHGDFIVNGNYAGGSNRVLTLDGLDKEIDGVGTVIGGFSISSGNKIIASTAVIDIIAGNITLGNSVNVTNNGRIYLNGNMTGANASSVWENAINSDLEISGALLTNGTLKASASGNTVNYTGTAIQTVKTPFNSTYHHLIISGTLVKNLSGALTINGDITLNTGGSLDVTANNYSINIKGDWINVGGIFIPRGGTVVFNGNLDQLITGPETYNNLTMMNATGDLMLNNDVIVSGGLTMSGKDIITGSGILQIGTDAINTGSVTYASGILIGKMERWAGTFGNLLFPVGTTGSYNPANIYINDLTTSGSVVGEYIPADPGSAGLPLDDGGTPISRYMSEGYWNFQAKNGFMADDYNVSLGTQNFTSYPVNINTRILKRTDGGDWFFDGTHATATPPTIYRNNLTGGISSVSTQFGVGFACAPATITELITNVTCFGGSDGSIDITVTDGTTPFIYAWSPGGETTEDISGLTAGPYGVTVTDANLCVTNAVFNVLQPSELLVAEAVTNVSCGGTDDGAIDITVTGGTIPYIYSWSTVDGSGLVPADEDQSGLTAGTYTVLVLDAHGCSVIKNIVVLQSIIPIPTLSGSSTVCQGVIGNIYTTESGMTDYIWSVSPGGSVTSGGTLVDNTITITWTTPGAHWVTVNYTNSFGCTGALPATINVTVDPLPGAAGAITGTPAVCVGETGIIYSIPAVTDATGYNWDYSGSGVTISGALNVISIDFSPTATSGVLTVYGYNSCGNGTISPNYPVTVSPENTISLTSAPATTNQSVCINTSIINITYATTGATGATIAGLPAGVTGNWVADVVTISGSPTESGTFNYSVTLTGGCGIASAGGTIISKPDNTITLISAAGTDNQTVCVNTPVDDIVYSYTGATGASFSGLPPGMTVSNVGNVITIKGTPTAGGVYTYRIDLSGGCGTVFATGIINVTPNNTITLSSLPGTDNQTVCINTAITDITYTTTGATGATITGLPLGVTGSWSLNVVTISGTPTEPGSFGYTIELTGGCGTITKTGTINVSPDNTITLSSLPGTDNQTVCINTAITDITYATTGATGATVTGLPLGVTGSWSSDVVTISGTPTEPGSFGYTVELTGGCGTITETGTINVTPDNTITLSSLPGTDNQTVCINTAITDITYATTGATGATVAGLPLGVTGTWSSDVVTISGTPTESGNFGYTIELTGGCGTITETGTINVTPDNTITLSSLPGTDNQTVCINTAITDITYATTGATGATVTGLPLGVTGSWSSDVVTISGTPTESGSFGYTVELTGGCGTITETGTINVSPDNTITLSSLPGTDNQTVCINTAITDITYATTGATGAIVTGLPLGVTGTWSSDVVTISGTPTESGSFGYTIELTGGCGTITETGTINVTPDNTITLSSLPGTDNQTVCINTAITDITYATTGATGATVTGLPLGVTGTWFSDVVTISGTPTESGSFGYTVELTGGCGTITETGTINVTPDNTITLSSLPGTDNQTVCINTAIIDITYATTGATGATVTGLPLGVTGTWSSDVVTISGTPTESGSFGYTVELTGGCGTITETGTINVTPDNTITLSSLPGTDNQTVCINTAITDITYATTGATGATVTGLPLGVTGTWSSDVVTITGTPTESGSFGYTVELTGGCGAITETGTINVSPDNTIKLSSLPGTDNQTVCINTAITDITYATTGATGATVTGLPLGVTGTWSSDVVTISGMPTEPGSFGYTIELTGGCGTVTETGSMTVNPDNTIVLTSAPGTDNQSICLGNPIVTITYATTGATGSDFTGLPPGMTVSWASDIVTISGTPLAAGVYTYQIDLTGGCGSISETGTITVNPDNTISLTSAPGTDNQTICTDTPIDDIIYATIGATDATVTGLPAGVTGTWASDVLTISGTPTESGSFGYTVELTGGCGIITTTGAINVTPDNTIILSSAPGTDIQSICEGSAITDISYSTTGATDATITGLPAGVTGAWAADVVTISGTPTESGIFNYTVLLTGGCGTITANGTITIDPILPVSVTVSPDANPACAGNTVIFTANPVNGGTMPSYQWQLNGLNVGLDSDTYSYVPADNDEVLVILTSNQACISGNPATSPAVVMTVNDSPSGSTTFTDVLCFGESTGSVDLTVTGGTMPYTFLWDNGAITEDLTDVAAGTYNVLITDANGCTAVASTPVGEPLSALTGSITSQSNVTTIGGNDGSVTVEGAGGTPTYLYSLDGGPFGASGTFGTLTAGSYVVTVQDLHLCTYDVPVLITQPYLPLAGSITAQTDVLCHGDASGSVTVEGIEGVSPYEYSINGVDFQVSGTFDNLTAGTYTVTIRDAVLNIFDVPVEILQPAAALTVAISQENVRCNGGSDAYAVALPAGGTGAYTYSWNTTPVQSADTAKGLAVGTYMVVVMDANLCTTSGEVTITEPDVLTASATTSDASCPDSEDGSISLTITGGTPGYNVYWEDGDSLQNRPQVLPDTYNAVITDAYGCATSVSATVGFIGTFNCVEIPNIITPDPVDGYNDEWIIRNIHIYPDAEVKVYTRWGKLIYHSKNPLSEPWDGRYSNGNLVPTDSYHYILDLHDGSKPRSGIISVIR